MTDERSIELEIEVPGTPEEVWRAIATGPGISSWYVPHDVEEKEGGQANASFGPGMDVGGRVAVWDPPHRIVFDGGEGVGGMAFEWLVEAKDGGTCIVRLVNSGFGQGDEWDDQFDAMTSGWTLFMFNLKLHLEHFAGQTASALLTMATWDGPRDAAWSRLTRELGISSTPAVDDQISIAHPDAPPLAGTVVSVNEWQLTLLLDKPAQGTAFIAAEGRGEHVEVSIWSYLYGEEGRLVAAQDEASWREWLASRAVPADPGSDLPS